ncbi:hypothetical protein Psed_6790 (plasmid) [Pseudonocardia dioxanivorans CB1190]|uniref:Uncharacterized protein n=1 Tax=Pseudonocardia dioxanivorans (strain ATCC 55486 / DSM 44775 / JCM 13855 / CB1190) TaxID=675635 RepID=F2L6H2_PSEUX|nr:hypothetical protein [Pseudonocardia dioxanivorans]AEA28866.1 hypothetical protein Psed_6790 [Pseudonocardia dioxanivorans CB1190]
MSDNRESVGPIRLDAGDAAELVEMLAFLGDWLDSTDTADFAGSLRRFTSGGYSLADLQADLARFTFLLGDDGERFFDGPEQQ